MIPVICWSANPAANVRDQWDFGLLQHLFEGNQFPLGVDIQFWPDVDPDASETVIFVVPARHNADRVADLNEAMARYDNVLLILIGDEEAAFPWREIEHPNARFWIMHPHPGKHADLKGWAYFFGTGYKYDTPELLGSVPPHKATLWAFAGQATHDRRKQAANGLRKTMARAPGTLIETRSFTGGLDRPQYLQLLAESQIAPCPSGPYTVDTFRFYEALEAGCFPLVDMHASLDQALGYWDMVYGDDFPFPIVNDWEGVGGWIEAECSRFPVNANVASAWWMQQKWKMARRLESDLRQFGVEVARPEMTVVVTTSAIPSHPDSAILDETLASVPARFPEIPIVIACDGLRREQEHLRDRYNEYVRLLCWRANKISNAVVVVSDKHVHQAEMVRRALQFVDTPTVLMMEHDTPLVTDEPIAFEAIQETLRYGSLDMVRLHHEAHIHPEHEHLMIDHETQTMLGVPLRRTTQWSQRPHLARTDYYRRILDENFPPGCSCFIEDKMHGIVQADPANHRIAIYHPTETNIKRSYHTDGRAGERKYDELQVFE